MPDNGLFDGFAIERMVICFGYLETYFGRMRGDMPVDFILVIF
jgi:hypothetical protein